MSLSQAFFINLKSMCVLERRIYCEQKINSGPTIVLRVFVIFLWRRNFHSSSSLFYDPWLGDEFIRFSEISEKVIERREGSVEKGVNGRGMGISGRWVEGGAGSIGSLSNQSDPFEAEKSGENESGL